MTTQLQMLMTAKHFSYCILKIKKTSSTCIIEPSILYSTISYLIDFVFYL